MVVGRPYSCYKLCSDFSPCNLWLQIAKWITRDADMIHSVLEMRNAVGPAVVIPSVTPTLVMYVRINKA